MFCDRDEKIIVENTRAARWSVAAHEDAQERTDTTPLRNEAQLNCVALRSQLDCEVTCGAVKGQDERPLRGALDSPASHHRGSMPTSENKLLKTRKTDKTGGCCGSTDLPVVAPERSSRETFCGNVAKATKNKKSEVGRHVGLDFYDLLIEAIEAAVEATKPSEPPV
jgi:hypothetical protein